MPHCIRFVRLSLLSLINRYENMNIIVSCFSDKLFRDRVLMSLAKTVPAGKTITYSELASLAGSPGKDTTSLLPVGFKSLIPVFNLMQQMLNRCSASSWICNGKEPISVDCPMS